VGLSERPQHYHKVQLALLLIIRRLICVFEVQNLNQVEFIDLLFFKKIFPTVFFFFHERFPRYNEGFGE